MKRFFLTIAALLMFSAFDAAALPKTQAKQVTVDPSGLNHSTNTTAQLVLEDLDEKISVPATTTTAGVVRFSTPAEVNAGTGTVSVITPADLTARLINTNGCLFSTNGYVRWPNGLIEQWGKTTDDVQTVTFPIPFSNACLNVTAVYQADTKADYGALTVTTPTRTNMIVNGWTRPAFWRAIGY